MNIKSFAFEAHFTHYLPFIFHLFFHKKYRVLISTGATGAAAPVNFGHRIHAPVNFRA